MSKDNYFKGKFIHNSVCFFEIFFFFSLSTQMSVSRETK